MELRHLRYFIAVAEERHFGRAAKRLRVAQPPVSRQIQLLEEELGFALFARTRRHVEITPAGAEFLKHARGVLKALELGIREGRRASLGQKGNLRVGYLSSLAYTGVTELLRAFRGRFPGVEVSLREMPPAEQLDALKSEQIDVGFVRALLDDETIKSECVRREQLVVALPSEHPLTRRKRIALKLLAHEPFIAFPRHRGPAFFDQIMGLCRDAGFTPRIVQEAPQLDIISLVAAGFGVAILPASVHDVHRPGIALRAILGSPTTELLIAWRAGDASPVLQGFIELVRTVGLRPARDPI